MLFFTVYQREPHARQMAFDAVPQPKTYDERATLARRTRGELGLETSHFLVDTLDDASRALFGDLPSPAIVIGADGLVKTKLPWAEPDILAQRLERIVTRAGADLEAAAHSAEHTPHTWVGRALLLVGAGDAARAQPMLEAALATVEETDAELAAIAARGLARCRIAAGADDGPAAVARACRRTLDAWKDAPLRRVAGLALLHDAAPDAAEPRAALKAALADPEALPHCRKWIATRTR